MDFFEKPRKLDKQDLVDMLLPDEFYTSRLSDIEPEELRTAVSRYVKNMKTAFEQRVGLLIWGSSSSAKNMAAAVLAKAARSYCKPTLYIPIWVLRESLLTRAMYKANKTPMERAKEVDFLVLDGLEEADSSEKFFPLLDIERLVVTRAQKGKLTVITTSLSPEDFRSNSKLKKFYDAVRGYLQPVAAPEPVEAAKARRKQMKSILSDD